MHCIHHTEGFIISGVDTKEADRFLAIFTRDFGLIRAVAGGIRKLSSKLRYALDDISHARIDLVRGREVWRITTAEKTGMLDAARRDPRLALLSARIFGMIKRLYHGEEPNAPLYGTLVELYSFAGSAGLSDDEIRALEAVMLARVLSRLGYGGAGVVERYASAPLSRALTADALRERSLLVAAINDALAASHL